jgi:hypothetical protein
MAQNEYLSFKISPSDSQVLPRLRSRKRVKCQTTLGKLKEPLYYDWQSFPTFLKS